MGSLMGRYSRSGRSALRCGQILAVAVSVSVSAAAMAQTGPLVLERAGRVVSLEPYALNIVRVTISNDKAAASARHGYGFLAQPSAQGWTHEHNSEGYEVFRSARMVVRVSPENLPKEKLSQPMPLDALNLQLRDPYFGGGGGHRPVDEVQVTTADGKTLLHMRSWAMLPESADVAAADAGAKGYKTTALFDSPQGEHYYGSIVPLGSDIGSTYQAQTIASVWIYPGADASFTLFQDDGASYGYEKGAGSVTKLTWDDKTQRLNHEGAPAWSGLDKAVVTVVRK